MQLTRVLAALLLFGVAFAYVEAAVVVYLRGHYDPIRCEAFGQRAGSELFPMLELQHLKQAGPRYTHMLWTELGRELATLVMLAAVGLVFAQNIRQWLAGFMIVFGVWDVFYYVFLKLLIDWPASLTTWDILFLLPVPWVGPVIAPALVALSMIAVGVAILWRESQGRPIRFGALHWVAIVGAGMMVIVAFCWDWRNTISGGWPRPFHWPLFAVGELGGLAAFVHAYSVGGGVSDAESLMV